MILRRLSIITGLSSLIASALLLGLHKGFDYGLKEFSNITYLSEGGYEFLTRGYISICFWLFAFLVGTLIKRIIVTHIICISSLFFVIVSYRLVYLQKSFLFENTETVTNILQVTFPLDLLNASLVLILLIAQIVSVFRHIQMSRASMAPLT